MLRRCHADACDLHARPGSEWARQNLDLYESCWLSLTGYSQSYFPEWLTRAGEYEFQLRTPTDQVILTNSAGAKIDHGVMSFPVSLHLRFALTKGAFIVSE